MLVVDDDPDILRLLAMLLESEGCSARKASTGAEALGMMEGVDVALVDQRMPAMTGTELIEAAKRAGALCRFLLISSDQWSQSEARLGGADGFLGKPIEVRQMLREIQRLFVSAAAPS